MRNLTMLTVADVEKSSQWYQDTFGMVSAHGGDEYELLIYQSQPVLQLHSMDEDDNHESLRKTGVAHGNGVLVWLQTEDVEEVITRLNAKQVPLDKEPFLNRFSGAREVWLYDPDGYRIVIAGIPNKGERF